MKQAKNRTKNKITKEVKEIVNNILGENIPLEAIGFKKVTHSEARHIIETSEVLQEVRMFKDEVWIREASEGAP